MLEVSPTIDLSPRPVLNVLTHESKKFFVVRDDLLPGGTKQRAAGPYIQDMMNKGYSHFTYASPFSGFAQVALASICQILGTKCTIVCEKDQRYDGRFFHPFSLKARSFGADLLMTDNLSDAEELASMLVDKKTLKIPLGFDCPEFTFYLSQVFSDALNVIRKEVPNVKNIWMPAGSGTLARTLLKNLPEDLQIKCVNVRVLPKEDSRLRLLQNHPQVEFFEAPELFREEALDSPSIPSNLFYDAKLWSFIKQFGTNGDVWWNVAK